MQVFQIATLIILTIAVWAYATFLGGNLGATSLIVLALLCWVFAAALTMAARNLRLRVWIVVWWGFSP